jgi:hypothetical protein
MRGVEGRGEGESDVVVRERRAGEAPVSLEEADPGVELCASARLAGMTLSGRDLCCRLSAISNLLFLLVSSFSSSCSSCWPISSITTRLRRNLTTAPPQTSQHVPHTANDGRPLDGETDLPALAPLDGRRHAQARWLHHGCDGRLRWHRARRLLFLSPSTSTGLTFRSTCAGCLLLQRRDVQGPARARRPRRHPRPLAR